MSAPTVSLQLSSYEPQLLLTCGSFGSAAIEEGDRESSPSPAAS